MTPRVGAAPAKEEVRHGNRHSLCDVVRVVLARQGGRTTADYLFAGTKR
jgi:hypothetical protein